jgi:outer membrane immunogenic protein
MLSLGSAGAADLGRVTRAPVAAPIPYYNWTGFYVGVHIGGTWADGSGAVGFAPTPAAFGATPFTVDADNDGFLGGVQIGYNWQAGMWVFGLEADVSFTGDDNTTTVGPILAFPGGAPIAGSFSTLNTEMNWFGTIRGRVGVAFDRFLLYATGGFAFADFDAAMVTSFAATGGGVFTAVADDSATGWTLGMGFEWALWPNWSMKAEYLYYDLGDYSLLGVSAAVPGFAVPATFELNGHIVRAGLNWRFGPY